MTKQSNYMQTKELLQKQIEKKKAELSALETQLTELQKQPDIAGARKWLVDFLNENFQSGRVTIKISQNSITYYTNRQWVFQQDRINRVFWVYYYRVWEALEHFGLKLKDIHPLLTDLVLKPFNCEGYITASSISIELGAVLKPFN